jgi:hypothetical protein
MTRISAPIPIATVVVVLALLTGCATGGQLHHHPGHPSKIAVPTPTAGPTGSMSATPSVTPSAAAVPLPATALFRITGVATAPDGAVADLTETVYAPSALSASEKAQITAQCPASGWPGNYPSPAGVRATVVAALHPGSKAWTAYSPVGVTPSLGNLAAWTGQFDASANFGCASPGAITIPGTTNGIQPVSPAGSPAGALGGTGWYNGIYGFWMYYGGNDPDGPPASLRVTLSDCAIEVGPRALAGNPATASWPTEAQDAQQYACWFGATS